jgi:NitT/TauT family transport system substrate-binding protein
MHKRIATLSAAALLALAAASTAIAQTKVIVGQVSRTAVNWPSFIAESEGMMKAEGITLDTIYVGNVALIAQQVVGGSLDIGNTTFETAIQAIESGAPLSIIGSVAIKYPFSLMSAKDVKTPADIKGKKVILPVPKSDMDNFITDWLVKNGMRPNDIDRVYDGSTTNRYAALKTGAVSAAAVTSPVDFTAAAEGFNKMIDFGSYVQGYGFIAIIARKDWLAKNEKTARGYLRAVSKATDWVYEPANRPKALNILVKESKQSMDVVEKTYDYFINQLKPFSRGLAIPDADIDNVIAALRTNGFVKSAQAPREKYIDLRYLK